MSKFTYKKKHFRSYCYLQYMSFPQTELPLNKHSLSKHKLPTSDESTPLLVTNDTDEQVTDNHRKKILLQKVKSHMLPDSKDCHKKQNQPLEQHQKNLLQLKPLRSDYQLVTDLTPLQNISNKKVLDPVSANSVNHNSKALYKTREWSQKLSRQNSIQTDPKLQQDCEKIYQQKIKKLVESKRKSNNHRIHITSSKQKENILNKINRLMNKNHSIEQQQDQKHVSNSKETRYKLSEQQKLQFPLIGQDMTRNLINNRERNCHSFMIRKKAYSSNPQQNQLIHKDVGQSLSGDKNNMKQMLIKQLNTFEAELLPKIKSRSIQYKNENKANLLVSSMAQGVKTLKIRRGKFTKISQPMTCEQTSTQLKKEQHQKSIFQNTIQNNLFIRQVNIFGSHHQQKRSMSKNEDFLKISSQRYKHHEKQNQLKLNQSHIQTEMLSCLVLGQNDQKVPSSKMIQNDKKFKAKRSTHHNAKVFNKRVSSIRAIKNYCRNSTQEKQELLAESKVLQSSLRKKQKQTACLTHKIKWGPQSRKKSVSEKGIDLLIPFLNNFASGSDSEHKWKMQNFIEQKIDGLQNKVQNYLVKSAKAEEQITKINPARKLRYCQDYRFLDESDQKGVLKIVSRKNSPENIEQQQASSIIQSIGERSLVVFQDPGISVIVRKESSIQSSQITPAHNTIEREMEQKQNGSQLNQSNKKSSHKKVFFSGQKQQTPVQSLKEIFNELKSHKSIYVPADDKMSDKED